MSVSQNKALLDLFEPTFLLDHNEAVEPHDSSIRSGLSLHPFGTSIRSEVSSMDASRFLGASSKDGFLQNSLCLSQRPDCLEQFSSSRHEDKVLRIPFEQPVQTKIPPQQVLQQHHLMPPVAVTPVQQYSTHTSVQPTLQVPQVMQQPLPYQPVQHTVQIHPQVQPLQVNQQVVSPQLIQQSVVHQQQLVSTAIPIGFTPYTYVVPLYQPVVMSVPAWHSTVQTAPATVPAVFTFPNCFHQEILAQRLKEVMDGSNSEGTSSFVLCQNKLRSLFPSIVKDGLAPFNGVWSKWLSACSGFSAVTYSQHDIVRLQLKGWAEEGELRIRKSSSINYEQVDHQMARLYNECVQEAQRICLQLVLEKGVSDVSEIRQLVTAQIPFFSDLSKSALKRIIISLPNSPLWVKGHVVKPRRKLNDNEDDKLEDEE